MKRRRIFLLFFVVIFLSCTEKESFNKTAPIWFSPSQYNELRGLPPLIYGEVLVANGGDFQRRKTQISLLNKYTGEAIWTWDGVLDDREYRVIDHTIVDSYYIFTTGFTTYCIDLDDRKLLWYNDHGLLAGPNKLKVKFGKLYFEEYDRNSVYRLLRQDIISGQVEVIYEAVNKPLEQLISSSLFKENSSDLILFGYNTYLSNGFKLAGRKFFCYSIGNGIVSPILSEFINNTDSSKNVHSILGVNDTVLYFNNTQYEIFAYSIPSNTLLWKAPGVSSYAVPLIYNSILISQKNYPFTLIGYSLESKKEIWGQSQLVTSINTIENDKRELYDRLLIIPGKYASLNNEYQPNRIFGINIYNGNVEWDILLDEREGYILNYKINVDTQQKRIYFTGSKGIYCYKIPE